MDIILYLTDSINNRQYDRKNSQIKIVLFFYYIIPIVIV